MWAWPTSSWHDGSDVAASPRQILRRQLDRLAQRGWSAFAGTELESSSSADSYEQAFEKGYRSLEPANQYNVDYSPPGHRARRAADPPHPQRDGGRGNARRGLQGGVQPRPARDQLPTTRRRLRTADEHVIYKNGAKEIAAEMGMALTFIGEVQTSGEGQLRAAHPLLARRRERAAVPTRARRVSLVPRRQLAAAARADPAGWPRTSILIKALRAGVRSRRRSIAWGHDNRTCAAARHRSRAVAALREPRRGGRPSTPTSRSRRLIRRRDCTGSTAPWSSARCSRGTPTALSGFLTCHDARRCEGALRWFGRLRREAVRGSDVDDALTSTAPPPFEFRPSGGRSPIWER